MIVIGNIQKESGLFHLLFLYRILSFLFVSSFFSKEYTRNEEDMLTVMIER